MNREYHRALPRGSAPLRVLHVISGLGGGGAENFLLRLLLSMSDTVDGRVVSLSNEGSLVGRFRGSGVEVTELGLSVPRRWVGLPTRAFRLAHQTRAWRPHVIQGWMNHGNLGAWMVRALTVPSAKLVWSIRQTIYDIGLERLGTRLAIRLQGKLSSIPDAIVCNSERGSEQHALLGFCSSRMLVIPNGFDLNRFMPRADSRDWARSVMGAGADELVVALIARYHPLKDHRTFLDAIAIASRKIPKLRAVCIGRGVNSGGGHVQSLVKELRLESMCTLLDERSDLELIYPGVDIVCSTSVYEGFPNTLGEAMASGVPCIATDVGEAAQIVGGVGYIVPPKRPQDVAAAIMAFSRLDSGARAEISRRARARVGERYSMPAIAGRYKEMYQRVIEGGLCEDVR